VNPTHRVLLQQNADRPRRDEVAKIEHAREPALNESSQYGYSLGAAGRRSRTTLGSLTNWAVVTPRPAFMPKRLP
jgi:hypothetical protein